MIVRFRTTPRILCLVWGKKTVTIRRTIFFHPDLLLSLDLEMVRRLVDHEMVHIRQWERLGVVRFLYQYLTTYLRGRLRGKGHYQAYLDIPLEVEARFMAGSKLS